MITGKQLNDFCRTVNAIIKDEPVQLTGEGTVWFRDEFNVCALGIGTPDGNPVLDVRTPFTLDPDVILKAKVDDTEMFEVGGLATFRGKNSVIDIYMENVDPGKPVDTEQFLPVGRFDSKVFKTAMDGMKNLFTKVRIESCISGIHLVGTRDSFQVSRRLGDRYDLSSDLFYLDFGVPYLMRLAKVVTGPVTLYRDPVGLGLFMWSDESYRYQLVLAPIVQEKEDGDA